LKETVWIEEEKKPPENRAFFTIEDAISILSYLFSKPKYS